MSDNNFKVKHGLEVASGVTVQAGGITVTGAAALDSLTLTTPLPASSGGTGTATSSGTGDLVLSTSPVFHTSIATDSTSFNLINTTATTVNFAGAATNLHIAGSTGTTTVNNNLHVAGDLTYDGQATVIQATPIAVDQPVIYLADGNTADTLDQGVIGKYNTSKYAGLIRDASDTGTWKLFSNLLTTPGNTVDFAAVTYDNLKIGALNATTGTFSAGVSGTTGTFSGAVSGTTGTFSGAVSGTTATLSGAATATNFVATATTGTAPFTVSSSTPVAGLNIGGYSAGLKTATGQVSVGSATSPTAGQVLTATNGTTAAWTTPAATGVTSVVGAGTVNGLTLTGTVTSTGNLTLGGTLSGVDLATAVSGVLPVVRGGTGVGTATGTGSVVLSTSPAITTSLTTPSTSFDLVNTTATTVNVAGAATTLRLGSGTGTTTINNNLQVAGTITYNGTASQLSPTNLSVSDSLIYMSAGNPADILDIGIIGHYANTKYSGFVRDASDAGSWKLFSNITTTPGATVDFAGASYDSLYVGNLHSNQLISTVATGTSPLVVSSATPVTGLNIDGYSTGLKTATTVVSVGAATAPTAGQVLVATSDSAAHWASPASADLSTAAGILPVSNGGTGSSGPATGTGNVVLATSPTLITPSLGSATATSVNKVTITQPASGSTLTIVEGSSLITSGAHSITLSSTADSVLTLPVSGTLLANNASVYLGTTSVALNRSSGSMVLSGVSVDGYAGALKSATTTVSISAATAPTTGQVLTAIDGSTATWQAPSAADLSVATGVLGVSHGGSGVTASTGTTKLVLSTSPTLSTSVLTDSTSFDLLNTTATTVNFAGAATALSMGSSTGTTTINNNLSVYGSIVFNNGATEISSTVLSVDDPLIYLGDNNAADLLDLGFIGAYNPGVHTHTGLVRDATDKVWKLFSGITTEPVGNVMDFSDAGLVYDDLHIGKLTASGVNKVTITQPSVGATLTLASGSSLITVGGNSLTLTTTGSTSLTLPTAGTLLADSSTVYIGTTSVALNRASGALTVAGLNTDGYAGALKTATGSVVVSAATAPTTGQILVATSGTTASWQTPASGNAGTVTSVAALTLTSAGSDVSSTVANGTTTPVITLNIPTSSATNRGVLSSADWSTFNGKLSSGGALGTPSSGTLTNCTGLPVSTGISGLATGAAAFLATPSSANLATLMTDETGSGANVFANTPTLVTPILGTPTSGDLSNCTNAVGYGLKSATTTVSISSSTAPTTGQVLTATGSTTATWQTPTAGGSGTVTSVSALTITTTGTDITSSVANGTTTPVITLNIPTASASNRGALSSTDWSTFNGKLSSGGALGTPASGTLTNCTGLPVSTGISGLATGVATFLATPTSANLAAAITDEVGTGNLVFTSTVNAITGRISDSDGNLRSVPQNNKTAAYTLVAGDNGKNINITTGGVTIPASVFVAGDIVSIYNQSDATQSITCSAVTLYIAGTSGAKTSLTLAARGILSILYVTATEVIASGNIS